MADKIRHKEQQFYLRLVLGDAGFNSMVRSLKQDPRIGNAHTIDIVVRKDGVERRLEADWLKELAQIVASVEPQPL